MRDELIDPPHEIICYALKVGDWFEERNITDWKIADCASRAALALADNRIAELEAEQVAWRIFTDMANRTVDEAERKLDVALEALNSIAKNTCCGDCQEAKKVAQKALAQIGEK